MKHYHFGTIFMEICQNDTVSALYVQKFAKTILFRHLCIEVCQNDTVLAPKNGNYCDETLLFQHYIYENLPKQYCFGTYV